MKPYSIGIDIGGTEIKAGLVTRDGQILNRYATRAHAEQQPEIVMGAIEQAYRALLDASDVDVASIEAVGLGFPGNVNGQAGIVLTSSNLPAWHHFPLRDVISEKLGMPVVLENDANVAALAEHRYGAGRGIRDLCYVAFSTGYGVGIIANNELYVGHGGTAGELGHGVVEIGGALCTCGKRGCLMAYASGIGLSRMAYEHIQAGAKTRLRQMVPIGGQRISGEIIAEAARQGDKVAREILRVAGYYAGVGLSLIVQLLSPQLIVVGGGLTHIGSLVHEPILAGLRENTQPDMLDAVQVVPWQLGDDLGILGAAANAFADTEQ